jgi:hypothetical protein
MLLWEVLAAMVHPVLGGLVVELLELDSLADCCLTVVLRLHRRLWEFILTPTGDHF